MAMTDELEIEKKAAAKWTVEHLMKEGVVKDGAVIGLGTGSTVRYVLENLGGLVASGMALRGVPTSEATARRATELGIPLLTLEDVESIDVTIDGMDEIDPRFNMIKGLGGALLREKAIASSSIRMFAIGDHTKHVKALGLGTRLPVEVDTFCLPKVRRALEKMGGNPVPRVGSNGELFTTDGGNAIIDVVFDMILNPAVLERDLDSIVGVIESGLFINLCTDSVIATGTDVKHRQKRIMIGGELP